MTNRDQLIELFKSWDLAFTVEEALPTREPGSWVNTYITSQGAEVCFRFDEDGSFQYIALDGPVP